MVEIAVVVGVELYRCSGSRNVRVPWIFSLFSKCVVESFKDRRLRLVIQ